MSTVVSANLTRHQLNATWPQEWFSLEAMPDLQRVDLSRNRIHGPMRALGEQLAAAGPTKVTTSTGEYYLHFKHNNSQSATNWIPASSSINFLDASHNFLSGHPSLKQFRSCSTLLLNNNQFTGPLESIIASTEYTGNAIGKLRPFPSCVLSIVSQVHLTTMLLSTRLAFWWAEVWDIGSNLLTGTLSASLGELTRLRK